MWEFLTKIPALVGAGVKSVAAGKTQANLGIQSPHLPSAIVRVGRFGYGGFGAWIAFSWYTAFVNQRVPMSKSWTSQFVLPGNLVKPVISSPDRPDKSVASIFGDLTSGGGGPLGPAGELLEEGLKDAGKAIGISNPGGSVSTGGGSTVSAKGRTLIPLSPSQLGVPGTAVAGSLWSAPDNQKQKPPYNAQRYRELLNVAQKVAKQYGLKVTSGYRPESGGSLHASGIAFDMVGRETDMRRAAAWASRNPGLFQEIFVHNEGSGLHLHLGFYPDAAGILNSRATTYSRATAGSRRLTPV
jgi:hypothetical protein